MNNTEDKFINILPINLESKKILKKRIDKLKRDPKGFIKGSYKKRSNQIKGYLPAKHSEGDIDSFIRGSYSFSIVTAMCDAEYFLDEYFQSIISQSLDFKEHIEIVCIDYGSKDKSASLIKKWQKKYPNNINYLYQDSSNRADALNLGLENASANWVTFVDPDDFISKDYFNCIDKMIKTDESISIISCNKISYIQQSNVFIDKYPLDYRFKNHNNLVPCSDIGDNILLHATATFIKVNRIPKNLSFDENLISDFVETKFINLFLLGQKTNSSLYFHPDAKYFFREYMERNLAVDDLWLDKDKYNDVIENGYLDLVLNSMHCLGYVPKHLQRTILWETLKYIRHLLDHEERVQILDNEDKSIFLELMKELFVHIDEETILKFNLANIAFAYKVGILEFFKEVDLTQQVAYIDKVDHNSNLFLIKFFSIREPFFQIKANNLDVLPAFYQKLERTFASKVFITEHRIWYPITLGKDIEFSIDGHLSLISYKGKRYKKLPKKTLIGYAPKNQSLWVFMDRDDRAADNAEFMYEFVKNSYPNQDICFVIDENAKDWNRLALKGFNLVAHGSDSHKETLNSCSLLISSQTNRITEPFKDIKKGYKIVFLQHGVIKDEMSNWLNRIDLDLMLTSTLGEYKAITDVESHYKYGKKEIKLTGLPRFDSLHRHKKSFNNQVFIMFTWRKSIAGGFVDDEKSHREVNNDFKDTDYFKKINGLLNSKRLAKLHKKYGTKFLLCPHPNMDTYIDCFNLPGHIDIASNEKTIHQMVNDSFMLLTDYSSISFDFAYQDKPVLYYQFDQDEMYNGSHTYTEGYFDHVRDGFGPVTTEETILLAKLEEILINDGKPSKSYMKRMQQTFSHHDASNCQRVYHALTHLNTPYDIPITVDYLMGYAQQALMKESWDLALERIDSALNHPEITQSQIKDIQEVKDNIIHIRYKNQPTKLASILWKENRIVEALEPLKSVNELEVTDNFLRLRVKLAILNNDFILARDTQKMLLIKYGENCISEDWQFYTQLAQR